MAFPLSEGQHFGLIGLYNIIVWPAQAILYLLALLLVVFAGRGRRSANLALAAMWIWAGGAYFLRVLSLVTLEGYVLGGLFILQGLLFLKVKFGKVDLGFQRGFLPSLGGVLVVYAMVAYPVVEYLMGHGWPWMQLIELPVPLAIYTLGLLLWAAEDVPAYTLVIPLIWVFVGTYQGILYGAFEDLGLLVAGVGGAAGLFRRKSVSAKGRLTPLGEE